MKKILPLCDYSHNITVDRAEKESKSGTNEVKVWSGINTVTADHKLKKRAGETHQQTNLVRPAAILRITRVEELISNNHRRHGQKATY